MTKITKEIKIKTNCAGYMWNNALYAALIGQSINSVLGLINQIIYQNNPNPLYNRNNVYSNNASKLFIRAQGAPYTSTMSIGNPYL
ncbi:MAG: hypothetical protein K2I36_02905 [Ureaplasma sp.]|nr:hypothetical protein [Ureaplasma sp.]